MKLIYALRFLTILPIPWREGEDLTKVARSTACFPLAGLIIGLISAGSMILLPRLINTPAVIALFPVLLSALLSGGLHLDGTADLADGLGAGKSPENRFKAMKDSSIGSFGVLALIAVLALKWGAFLELSSSILIPILIIVPVCGRWLQVLLIALYPSAAPEGIGAFFQQSMRKREILHAGISTLLIMTIVTGFWGLLVCSMVSMIIACSTLPVSRKLGGGLSGDVYGAMTEWGEALFLWLAILLLPLKSLMNDLHPILSPVLDQIRWG